MSPIGFKQIRTSDISGKVLDDDNVVTVVVKGHPDLDEGKVFDAASEELKPLKTLDNLVTLELRQPDGTVTTVACTKAEFAKVVPAETLANADGTRGRRRGYRPQSSES